jgi:hypothetical protein
MMAHMRAIDITAAKIPRPGFLVAKFLVVSLVCTRKMNPAVRDS